jgi:hypothetical protein
MTAKKITMHTWRSSNILGAKLKAWIIPITGQSSGTPTAGTMVFSATEDMTLTATGDVSISVAYAADSIYRLHTVTINCPNGGSGTIRVPDRSKIVAMGNHRGASAPNVDFYTGINTTAPILSWNLNDLGANVQKVRQITEYTVILPATGNRAMPTELTFLFLIGNNISWSYSGALPQNINSILGLSGNNISWSYSGALPQNISVTILLSGNNINWTGLDISGSGNITSTFSLTNFRIAKMSSPDMVTLLTSLTNRVGGLPATITINDYADYLNPPQSVIDAVAALKVAKPNVTTVNLGA